MSGTIRIGLFGGAFDPIHQGHKLMMREVLTRFPLDRIILIPAGAPPHKLDSITAPAYLRLAMAQEAMTELPDCITVSALEFQRQGASFTIDTVQHFLDSAADQDHFFLLLGIDAMLEFDTWKYFEKILRIIDLIVMERPITGLNPDNDSSSFQLLTDFLYSRISADYYFSASEKAFIHPQNRRIYYFKGTLIPISSTLIRNRVKNRLPIDHLVPQSVKHIIIQESLYL